MNLPRIIKEVPFISLKMVSFVYAANRGHDSIAVFAVNQETGKLSLVQIISTEGHWPRDFSIDPSRKLFTCI